MADIGVLGAGTFGIALSRMLALSGHKVTVWSALEQEIDVLTETHRHPNLPQAEIPDSIAYTKDIAEICRGRDILLFAVASVYVRPTAKAAAPHVRAGQVIVDVAKGIEAATLKTMSAVIREEMPQGVKVVALSGPTHAEEIARDLPSAIVSACDDIKTAEYVQEIFMNTCLRVYTNPDILGIELCGALKNIIALASGVIGGLGYGDNTKAALITRGMAEIARLGKAMGCLEQTFSGLAGIGDLIVTATSVHSRNNRCGTYIGEGLSVKEAVDKVGMVVEGINAIPAAMRLKEQYRVELPIISAVNDVVNGGVAPADAVRALMARAKKTELADLEYPF